MDETADATVTAGLALGAIATCTARAVAPGTSAIATRALPAGAVQRGIAAIAGLAAVPAGHSTVAAVEAVTTGAADRPAPAAATRGGPAARLRREGESVALQPAGIGACSRAISEKGVFACAGHCANRVEGLVNAAFPGGPSHLD